MRYRFLCSPRHITPPPLLLSPCTYTVIFGDTELRLYTLRAQLSSRLQWCHRRVQTLERTIPPHHSAHRCTCRWRTTTSAYAPCIPTDTWARAVHNPSDPDRETCPCSAGHRRNGGSV